MWPMVNGVLNSFCTWCHCLYTVTLLRMFWTSNCLKICIAVCSSVASSYIPHILFLILLLFPLFDCNENISHANIYGFWHFLTGFRQNGLLFKQSYGSESWTCLGDEGSGFTLQLCIVCWLEDIRMLDWRCPWFKIPIFCTVWWDNQLSVKKQLDNTATG